ncbi:hypothetical protein BASA83_003192 [Batrachochytrium salamandrivorans]|nr:hypothetical protein BASA83_003192 [Batrachochytrium salamandrivorans]
MAANNEPIALLGLPSSGAHGGSMLLGSSSTSVVLRINVPSLKLQKAIKSQTCDTVWMLKKQLIDKFGSESKDCWNFGIFLHGKEGKQGKFLDERKDLSVYNIDSNSQIDFALKIRLNAESDSKKQRKLLEEVQKGNLDRAREKITKSVETNFWTDNQETLLATAVMNNDRDMIVLLLENGAFIDYRNGDKDGWKTPLHMAAVHNKNIALKTLLEYGAWANAVDTVGLTPIYYAATAGFSECVLRLLMAKADTEVYDESGKGPLHQAALNNFDCIVAMLIDFGANMHSVNVAGNTPLHVAATRNSKESTKWLLLRGAARDRRNKTSKTPQEAAIQANCPDTANIINKFTDDQIVPPPPLGCIEGDTTLIISNILASIAASIGGEYKPQPFVAKAVHARMSALYSPSIASNANPHAGAAQGALQSQASPLNMAPSQTQSPLLQRRPQSGNMSESDLFSESRKSVRRSVVMPPPPPRHHVSVLGIPTADASVHSRNGTEHMSHDPSEGSTADNTTTTTAMSTHQPSSDGPLDEAETHPSQLSQSGLDLSESMGSILPSRRSVHHEDLTDAGSWSATNLQKHDALKARNRSHLALSGSRSLNPVGPTSIVATRHVTMAEDSDINQQPEVLYALKRIFGDHRMTSSNGNITCSRTDATSIVEGVDELEAILSQTLQSIHQLEAENRRLHEELGHI